MSRSATMPKYNKIECEIIESGQANVILNSYHYLGPVTGMQYAIGSVKDEIVLCFGNLRSRILEKRLRGANIVPIELLRMAAKGGHDFYMSDAMAQASSIIKSLGYHVIVTYADPFVKHDGLVYRAASWLPCGYSAKDGHPIMILDGKIVSPHGLYHRHGTQSVPILKDIYGDRIVFESKPPKRRYCKILVKGKKRKLIVEMLGVEVKEWKI